MATQNGLKAIGEMVDKLNANRVARFAYTEDAFNGGEVDGVDSFDALADQNIPKAERTDYHDKVLDKGVRQQGASIPRMGHNHFLGRTSYNLNMAILKLASFFPILRKALAHNANEYDPQAEYYRGDVCYLVHEITDESGEAVDYRYTWYVRVSASPLVIVNVSPEYSTTDWTAMTETTVANLAGDSLPLMNGISSAGTSILYARVDHAHPHDITRAADSQVLYDQDASSFLPGSGTVNNILQAVRNCLKWLASLAHADSRGITQLTGDVTAPLTTNGSAYATLAASGAAAGAYGDGGASRTLNFGGAFKIPKTLTVDSKGRVTAAEALTLTLPGNPNTDTDNRGIAQLTGDVIAPFTVSGAAQATIKESVALTGEPTAPTPAQNSNSTRLATTAFSQGLVEAAKGYVPKAEPVNDGVHGRIWTNAEGLLVVNDHIVEWGREIDVSDLVIRASGGETIEKAIEVSGVYRFEAAGGRGGKGGNAENSAYQGGAGGSGHVVTGTVALRSTEVMVLSGGAAGADGANAASSGKSVIVGASASFYSQDGLSWTAGVFNNSLPFAKVVSGNGVFVGMRFDGYVAVSSDGATWTLSNGLSIINSTYYYGLAYGNGIFVLTAITGASGSYTTVAISVDGLSWSLVAELDIRVNADSLGFGAGLFFFDSDMTAGATNNQGVATSSDGISWQITRTASWIRARKIVCGDGVVVGLLPTSQVSVNAYYARRATINLTTGSIGWSSSSLNRLCVALAHGAGMFVAISEAGACAVSFTGATWVYGTLPLTTNGWTDIAYINGRFIAVGTDRVATSPDGLVWTMLPNAPSGAFTAIAAGSSAMARGGKHGQGSGVLNLTTGAPLAHAEGGGGGGGAYNPTANGEDGEGPNGGAGGTSASPAGGSGAGGTSPSQDGYAMLVFQRPL